MLVDDHASVRSAGAQSAPEGVECHRSAHVAGEVGTGLTLVAEKRASDSLSDEGPQSHREQSSLAGPPPRNRHG